MRAAVHPRLRGRFAVEPAAARRPSRFAYEVLVRIPLGTAFAEEAMFRGTLLGLSLRQRSWPASIARNALCFGLWHILPTVAQARARGEARAAPAQIAASVLGTAFAGVVFAALRRRTGDIVAPTIVHGAVNASALGAARRARGAVG